MYLSIIFLLLLVVINAPAVDTDFNRWEPAASNHTILFFGNSLTAGYGLDPARAFPALIQEKIDEAGLDFQVVNAGLSGETSAGGLARIDWVLNDPVEVFVLELGANDGLRGLPLDQTECNLRGIIEKVQSKYPQASIVIAGMKVPPNMGEPYSHRFTELYRDLAEQHDAKLIPFLLEGVGGDPDLNLPDGIHPNAAGHRIVAQTVWEVLQPLLVEK